MARPKLRNSDQPHFVQLVFGTFELFASLKLAVSVIFSSAAILAWATFVESEYGTPAVKFGVYDNPLFGALFALLGINVFSAAVARYPWKKYQLGFVVTHIGLLTLLLGCLITRQGWIDAQMPIFEGGAGYRAFTADQHFELTLREAGREPGDPVPVIEIPFRPGPFNWGDYGTVFNSVEVEQDEDEESSSSWLTGLPGRASIGLKNLLRFSCYVTFNAAHRNEGVLYDDEGIKLEVLEFYSDAMPVQTPFLGLRMSMPRGQTMGADGRQVDLEESFVPINLRVRNFFPDEYLFGIGASENAGGGRITFTLAGTENQAKAFRESQPEGDLGENGQIVLHVDGHRHVLQVDELLKEEGGPQPLGGISTTTVELVLAEKNGGLQRDRQNGGLRMAGAEGQTVPGGPAVELKITRGGGETASVILFADHPNMNLYDYAADVFGSYWYDHGEIKSLDLMRGKGGSRIDILQAQDETLYYRYWNRKDVAVIAELPRDGAKVDAFKMPVAQLQMFVDADEYLPSKQPGEIERPVAFSKDKIPQAKRPAALVRLTVDGNEEEFWIAGMPVEPDAREPREGEIEMVGGDERAVSVTFRPTDAFMDVGLQVHLDQFHRKLDPGTSQAAFYGSTVDISTRDPNNPLVESEVLGENVLIEMNVPKDFVDPVSGHTYRFFQESFSGPFKPGSAIYDEHAAIAAGREHFYTSTLTVNYDPGRGVKYAGCLLVCSGIFMMFFMRAYFFKSHTRAMVAKASSAYVASSSTDRIPQPVT